ncbi:hypothetical protein [Clostridium perfringens]|uniref:hypothetical protein n=1 Tax=Clostridium perfringens TaxID=1502 RepID=UPI001A2747F0|nr:hypothetical protein [Clostridium perfringens]MBO3378548.1 hypothetical protein [Clostridium perfringens]WCM69423.1 hypothetical protein LZD60_12160 [Clostridium perfringens]WEV19954.1 hypothetical protein PL323_04810 [Clostridium perfringens D]HAT4352344.1 hypothetical protein [Clostridium perfringens]
MGVDFNIEAMAQIQAQQEEMRRILQAEANRKIAKENREYENNKNLKEIANYNEGILNYNKTLVSLNEKILTKIESLDDTLSFLNNSFNKKSEFDKKKAIEKTALLLELVQIIEEKDNNKLEKFINNVGAPLGVGLLTEYLKMKLGIS